MFDLWNGSKLLINENIPEIKQFKASLPKEDMNVRPTQSTQTMSQWTGGNQYTPEEKIVSNAMKMTLKDICKLRKDTLCVTVATTLKFCVSKYGWFYYSCTTKAADPKQSYTCKCGEVVPEPIPRYKLEIYVKSGDSQYRFAFWDAECAEIIGKSAVQMLQMMLEEGEDDPMVYPADLDKMLNLRMVCRVKIQGHYICGSVYKISMDEEFIKKIENELNIDEAQSGMFSLSKIFCLPFFFLSSL